jgi:5-hydroxyisourate hydrolase
MKFITTHVLDTATGKPVADVPVILQFRAGAGAAWATLSRRCTDADGRVRDLLPETCARQAGDYRLLFDTSCCSPFFPEVSIRFIVRETQSHYHIPLLLSNFGYTTYRGS